MIFWADFTSGKRPGYQLFLDGTMQEQETALNCRAGFRLLIELS